MKLPFHHSALKKSLSSGQSNALRFSFPIFMVLFLSLYSCTHKITTSDLPKTQIIFGKGGGFTGQTHDFALLQDGRIIELHADSTHQEVVKTISKDQAAKFYASIDSMPSKTWLYNVPGNIYHHITIKKEGAKDRNVVWDGSREVANAPAYIVDFYNRLRAEVPKKKHHADND
jgi:hypothetical protein